MINRPFFSVLTIVKNSETKILKTLKSVKNQTCKDYEHVIVDGFSNDQTFKLIKNFKSNNIKKKQLEDKNLYDGLNNGLKICNGKYIVCLHSGDIFYSKNILKIFKNKLKQADYDVLVSGCVFSKKNKIVRTWKTKKNISFFSTFKIPHTGLYIRKNIINKIGKYNIAYDISSDADYILRMMKIKRLKILMTNHYSVNMTLGGLSTSSKNFFKKFLEDIKIYYEYYKINFIFIYLYKLLYKLTQFKL